MSNAKHTPGPWVILKEYNDSVEVSASRPYRIDNISANTPLICYVYQHPKFNGFSPQANANLIAAAPELLEALRLMVALEEENLRSGDDIDVCFELESARTAIAKATGAESSVAQELETKDAKPIVLPEPVAAQVRFKPENDTAWSRWKVCAVEDAREIEAYTLANGWGYEVRYLHAEQQVRELLAQAPCTKAQTTTQEPFGYFKLETSDWRWMDCAEFDEGARPLYEAPPPQADALDAKRWVSESDSKPLESDGEVFVRFSDGTFGIGWASYWHGASNDFAQWSHPDPDEDRTVTHWMKPPTIYTAAPAKENK